MLECGQSFRSGLDADGRDFRQLAVIIVPSLTEFLLEVGGFQRGLDVLADGDNEHLTFDQVQTRSLGLILQGLKLGFQNLDLGVDGDDLVRDGV